MQGKTINGFTLQHLLGTGGMAEVWQAENKIGKKAAVKLLLPRFCADESIVSRFENEAKMMVILRHPNIRQVYDYDAIEGRPCIIMEYLEGNDLKGMMKQGRRFRNEELEKWWNQLVEALNYTHALGIVHRDIKPSNIFIDERSNAKLLDFGVAKNNEGGSGTMTGSTLGTRIYMSPEQVKDPKRVDYRTDYYSLAVTFVHLLSGKAPYDSTTSSDFEIQLNIVTKPLDLSTLPEQWRSFLEPYLEKEPSKRLGLHRFDANISTDESTIIDMTVANKELKVPDNEETVLEDVAFRQPRKSVTAMNDMKITVKDVAPFVMKHIEGGTYLMGSCDRGSASDESPVHSVTIRSFFMSETVVTQALWKAVMCDNPSRFQGDDMPVETVSWIDCQEFIKKLNQLTGKKFRLPTEAEWEFAARGGNNSCGYRFAGSNNIDEVAWYTGTTNDKGTKPVKIKSPNELGLYDMSGNVWEWCQDWYGDYCSVSQNNPEGPSEGLSRVLRGGSWYYRADDCRVSCRDHGVPGFRYDGNGFRLVLSQ